MRIKHPHFFSHSILGEVKISFAYFTSAVKSIVQCAHKGGRACSVEWVVNEIFFMGEIHDKELTRFRVHNRFVFLISFGDVCGEVIFHIRLIRFEI